MTREGKTLDSNNQNQVAGQRFSLKQSFAGGAQSRGLRKPWLWSLLFKVFPREAIAFRPAAMLNIYAVKTGSELVRP